MEEKMTPYDAPFNHNEERPAISMMNSGMSMETFMNQMTSVNQGRAAKFCFSCGSRLEKEGQKFCQNCGMSLGDK